MGRELQKRKNRSSRPKVKPRNIGRTKAGKKRVNFLGNEIIASNWDRNQTLEQNYKRLGLSTKLNSHVSLDKRIKGRNNQQLETNPQNSLSIKSTHIHKSIKPQEIRVERDPKTGHILQVIRNEEDNIQRNPMHDPLNELSDEEIMPYTSKSNGIVAQLEAQAEKEAEVETRKKRPRQQSAREEEWITKLVQVHGDNIAAMSRDRKLNPMQQSEGDIARRVKRWKQKSR